MTTRAEKIEEAAREAFNAKRPGYHDCLDNGEPECEWCLLEKALALPADPAPSSPAWVELARLVAKSEGDLEYSAHSFGDLLDGCRRVIRMAQQEAPASDATPGGLDDLVERGMQAKLEAYRKGSDILHELSCNCGDETCRACIIFKALPSLGPVKLPAPSGEPQKGGGK